MPTFQDILGIMNSKKTLQFIYGCCRTVGGLPDLPIIGGGCPVLSNATVVPYFFCFQIIVSGILEIKLLNDIFPIVTSCAWSVSACLLKMDVIKLSETSYKKKCALFGVN